MVPVRIVITTGVAAWSLVAGRLERWHVRAPLMLVLAGVVTGLFTHSHLAETLNSKVAQHIVVRVLPVLFAFLGSGFTWRDRVMVGAVGPRGTTSIVFGLLAFNALPDGLHADTALYAMTLTALGSVLLHGGGSVAIARLLNRPSSATATPRSSARRRPGPGTRADAALAPATDVIPGAGRPRGRAATSAA
ncbi:hypothetical protein KCMC57_up15530 [Kitasatospora sp. CMC57]|uniref:Cation/H+ exchanger transmembrane domain-containing protein n=1 Tax=Kitasatospora sp. CMC57 TaxID=3231513 RepID=A0AB33JV58_9ACTN